MKVRQGNGVREWWCCCQGRNRRTRLASGQERKFGLPLRFSGDADSWHSAPGQHRPSACMNMMRASPLSLGARVVVRLQRFSPRNKRPRQARRCLRCASFRDITSDHVSIYVLLHLLLSIYPEAVTTRTSINKQEHVLTPICC